jgi:hypothetical protein
MNSLYPRIICTKTSLIKIGLLVLDKIFFFNFQSIFTHLLLSPLGEGFLHLYLPTLVKIGPVILEKKFNICRSLWTDDGQTDRQQAIRKTHLSFQLR